MTNEEQGMVLQAGLGLEVAFRRLSILVRILRAQYGDKVDLEINSLLKSHCTTADDIEKYQAMLDSND